jgi:predicted PurR-regulated permease PerM
MVIVVVIINTLISLILLYIARQVWQLKKRLVRITNSLTAAERFTHALLDKAPENISRRQQNIHNLRQGNQSIQVQIQQVRQIFSLLLLGQQIQRRYFVKVGLGTKFQKKIVVKSTEI